MSYLRWRHIVLKVSPVLATLTILLALVALTSLAGCDLSLPEKEPKPITETETPTEFNEIFLQGEGELTITQGEKTALEIEAEQLDMPKIGREVVDGRLLLRTDMLRSPLPIIFNVTVKDLNKIMLSGPGHVSVSGLETDYLDLDLRGVGSASVSIDELSVAEHLSLEMRGTTVATITNLVSEEVIVRHLGSGDATLSGTTTSQQVHIANTGDYDGSDLESSEATVEIAGDGTATLQVEDQLDVQITGSGSVRYAGDPTVTEDISGEGTVEHLEE